jgi:rRNA maturation RNase YbeY
MEGTQPVSVLDLKGLPPRLRHLKRSLGMAAQSAFGAHAVKNYALSITFVGDREIARLNRSALGRKGPTDVIAFDLSEEGLPYGVVGDVYISLDRARAASKALKISESEEVTRLAVHGMLHVLGHRDDSGPRRRRMELVQERMVKRLLGKPPRRAGRE